MSKEYNIGNNNHYSKRNNNVSYSKASKEEEVTNFRNNVILKYKSEYKTLGNWVRYCKELVKVLELKGSLSNNQLKGELSEVVLEVLLNDLQDMLKTMGVNSTIIKNLAMVNRSETNEVLYSTEVDVCLVTEYRCYLFEVKSYTGNKILTKECYLKGKSSIDIYEQSKLHMDIFEKIFSDCRVKYAQRKTDMASPYKLLFFEFSSKEVTDNRDNKWKTVIPYLNTNNFYEWASEEFFGENSIINKKQLQWDLKKVTGRFKTLDINHDLIMKYHINRLKGGNRL